ncbi:hypothetical protein LTR95_016908 [Oleoguttula sp. CCFEE 5521]
MKENVVRISINDESGEASIDQVEPSHATYIFISREVTSTSPEHIYRESCQWNKQSDERKCGGRARVWLGILLSTLLNGKAHRIVRWSAENWMSIRNFGALMIRAADQCVSIDGFNLEGPSTIIEQLPMANPPRRIAQTIRLRRSSLEAYKALHAAIWPAVLKQIKDCNIVDYSIFLDEPTMMLFAVMKYTGSDWEADMEKMQANDEVRRWWKETDAMQETFVEGSTGSVDAKGWWRGLEELMWIE